MSNQRKVTILLDSSHIGIQDNKVAVPLDEDSWSTSFLGPKPVIAISILVYIGRLNIKD
jgi:hypothetical protein